MAGGRGAAAAGALLLTVPVRWLLLLLLLLQILLVNTLRRGWRAGGGAHWECVGLFLVRRRSRLQCLQLQLLLVSQHLGAQDAHIGAVASQLEYTKSIELAIDSV